VQDAMAINPDFAPTFLDMAGLAVPADMQGRSLVPLLVMLLVAGAGWTFLSRLAAGRRVYASNAMSITGMQVLGTDLTVLLRK